MLWIIRFLGPKKILTKKHSPCSKTHSIQEHFLEHESGERICRYHQVHNRFIECVCVLCVCCARDIARDETKTETRRRSVRGRDRTGGRDAGIASLSAFLLNSFAVEPLMWSCRWLGGGGLCVRLYQYKYQFGHFPSTKKKYVSDSTCISIFLP